MYDEALQRLRTKLGRADAEARKAREILAEFRAKEFAGVAPEDVAAARDLARTGERVSGALRERIGELETRERRAEELTGEADELRERIAELTEEDTRRAATEAAAARVLGGRGAQSEYRDGAPLAGDQSMRGFVRARGLVPEQERDGALLSLQKWLRGATLGDWEGADAERRVFSGATPAAGGFLVPTVLSAEIIDLARNQARVIQAGGRVYPMAARTLNVARWEGDPSAAWRNENAAIPTSDPVVGQVQLVAKSLASQVVVSRELLEDAENVDGELSRAFAAAIALEIDRAALYGSGTDPEPLGIANTAGILTASMGASGAPLADFDPLVDAVGSLRDNNENPSAFIFAPRTGREIGKLKDSTNQPLRVPPYIADLPRLETNQVPTNLTVGANSDCSDVFTGDFSQVFIGTRTQLSIQVLVEAYAATGQIGFIAWWRGDVAVAREKAFHVLGGVR